MIVKKYDLYDFKREFEKYDKGNNFSEEAFEELFEYYDNSGEIYELDVIQICSFWTEYESLEDFAKFYMKESELKGINKTERESAILDELNNKTCFSWLSNGKVLIQNY